MVRGGGGALTARGPGLETVDFGWGIIVRAIDGISGNWFYFINENAPGVGSDAYSLKDGDIGGKSWFSEAQNSKKACKSN